MEDKKIHLEEKDAKNGVCESCERKEALHFKFIIPNSEDKIYVCEYCGHQETFHTNGRRKENTNWSRYC